MDTKEADEIHGLVMRSRIGLPFVRVALIAFNMHQLRDAASRETIDCGHPVEPPPPLRTWRWKSIGEDGFFCWYCMQVYPVRPANPPQFRPTQQQMDGAVAELRLFKRMAEAPRRSR